MRRHAGAETSKAGPDPTRRDPLKSSLDIPEPTRIGMLLLRPYSRFVTRSRGAVITPWREAGLVSGINPWERRSYHEARIDCTHQRGSWDDDPGAIRDGR